jgi:prolyl oligopeptidase
MARPSRFRCPLIPLVLLAACDAGLPPYPETRVDTTVDTLHGVAVPDPYRWLEDQEAPETRAWIDAQNSYTDRALARVPGREEIAQRLGELLRVTTVSQPIERAGRYFYSTRTPEQQLAVIAMRDGAQGREHVLIDPHGMSEDQRTSVRLMGVSNDGRVLTYGVQEGGQDEIEVRFFDVDARQDLPDRLPRGRYFSADILPDRTAVYYTSHDQNGPRLRFHVMGAPIAQDRVVFGEGLGPDKIVYAAITEDDRRLAIIVLHGSAGTRTDLHWLDLARQGPVQTLVDDVEAQFNPSFAGDDVILHTTWNAARGRVLRVSLANPARSEWKEIVPESDDIIQSVSTAGGRIFVNTLKDVQSAVDVYDLDGNRIRQITFPTLGSIGGVSGRWASDEAFVTFTSFHVPPTIYRYEVESGERTVWFRPDVPVDSDALELSQVWFESKDGTRVPMFLLHRRDFQRNGDNLALLTGYGGFNISLTPYFDANAVIVAERGGVFALANLRGGSEFGEGWHRSGMFGNKQNVFDDFIGAAEYLVAQNYTRPERLAIEGGSNGGLLVGAAVTQRPDLFGAVVCAVPLLDMVRYHNFLVARFWVSEYGSSDDPAQFRYLLTYSPYHNVRAGTAYPSILFVTGDGDTRVAPLHARKMAARVQAATTSGNPILLRYDTKSGHAGGDPVDKQIEDGTAMLQFILWRTGALRGA